MVLMIGVHAVEQKKSLLRENIDKGSFFILLPCNVITIFIKTN